MINTTIAERYTLEKKLGEGSFGKVYYAYDHKLCKYWAVKVLSKPDSTEAEILKKIDNYAFPRIVDVVYDNESTILVMDYIEGTTLDKYLATHALTEREVLLFATKIARALDYLHHMTPVMIYMDCKPSNIIVTPQKDIRLVDMGSIYISDTHGQKRSGTIGYAPLEITSKLGTPSPSTDIYSLGMTIYKMLCSGSKEYRDKSGNLSIRKRNKKITRQTEAVIQKCTNKNPKARYHSMTELIYDLESAKKSRKVDITFSCSSFRKLLSAIFDACVKGILAAGILYCASCYNQLNTPLYLMLLYLIAVVFLLLCRDRHLIVTETKTDLIKTAGPRLLLSVVICTLCSSAMISRVSASGMTPLSENNPILLTDEVSKLPVTLYDENECNLLLSHGTCWETSGDLKLSIPLGELGSQKNKITIICETIDGVKSYSFEAVNSSYVN